MRVSVAYVANLVSVVVVVYMVDDDTHTTVTTPYAVDRSHNVQRHCGQCVAEVIICRGGRLQVTIMQRTFVDVANDLSLIFDVVVAEDVAARSPVATCNQTIAIIGNDGANGDLVDDDDSVH